MFRSSKLCRLCLIEVNAVNPIFSSKDVAETSSIQMKIMELANVQVYAGDGLPSNVCLNCNKLLDSYHAFKTQIEKSDVILRHQLSTSQTDPLSIDSKVENSAASTPHGEFVKAETLIIKDEEIDEDHVESIMHASSHSLQSSPLLDTGNDEDDDDDDDRDMGGDMDVDNEEETDPLASDILEDPSDQQNLLDKPATAVTDTTLTTSQSIPFVSSTSSIPIVPPATPIVSNPPGNVLLVATPLILNSGNEPGKPSPVSTAGSFVAIPTNVSSTFVTVPTSAIKAPEPTATVTSVTAKKRPARPKKKTVKQKDNAASTKPKIETEPQPGPSTSMADDEDEDDVDDPKTEEGAASTSTAGDQQQVDEELSLSHGIQPSWLIVVTDNSAEKAEGNQLNNGIKLFECKICGTKRENYSLLARHMKWHDKMRCNDCNKTLPTLESLARHKKLFHKSSNSNKSLISCQHCDLSFSNQLHLINHGLKLHPKRMNNDDILTCNICNKSFRNLHNFRSHCYRVHSGMVECDVCCKKLRNKNALLAHKTSCHSNDDKIECEICGKMLKNARILRVHKRKLHDVITNKQLDETSEICKKSFKSHENLKLHRLVLHNVKKESSLCDLCGKSFRNSHSLRIHLYRVHLQKEDELNCDVCGKHFPSTYRMRIHKKNVHTDEPMPCHMCEKVFKNRINLKLHIRNTHFKKKPKRALKDCLVCGKSFRFLKYHIENIHSDHVSMTCEDCGKKFRNEKRLNLHKYYIHGNGKINKSNRKINNSNRKTEYVCEMCGAKFFYMSLLESHLRAHSEERNHQCEICKKAFKFSARLKEHMRVHNGLKPYVCCTCGESFKWKQRYDNHLLKCSSDNLGSSKLDNSESNITEKSAIKKPRGRKKPIINKVVYVVPD